MRKTIWRIALAILLTPLAYGQRLEITGDLNKSKEARRRARQENLKSNNYGLNRLGAYYPYGNDLGGFLAYEEKLAARRSVALQQAARPLPGMNN